MDERIACFSPGFRASFPSLERKWDLQKTYRAGDTFRGERTTCQRGSSPDGDSLFTVNTPDGRLAIFDVSGDGRVTSDDSILTRAGFAGAAPLAYPSKCNVIGDTGGGLAQCTIRNAALQARHAAGLGPELQQICGPAI